MSKDLENAFFDEQRKRQEIVLEDLETPHEDSSGQFVDKSRKGSVDERIFSVVKLINSSKDLYTSSSCSGRAILFTHDEAEDSVSGKSKAQKKGCKWLYVTHDAVDPAAFKTAWEEVLDGTEVTFKIEACIFHIQCRKLSDAKKLVHVATESGFRNSGMVISGKNKITVAVRSAISMEVPMKKSVGDSLLTEDYLDYVLTKANTKLVENWERTERFHEQFKKYFSC